MATAAGLIIGFGALWAFVRAFSMFVHGSLTGVLLLLPLVWVVVRWRVVRPLIFKERD